jgi:predicted DNA-binding transcriptional regulator AlpA
MHDEEFLDTPAAVKLIKLSASTLTKLRLTGDGPRYLKLGRRVVYSRAALIEWMHERECGSTSEYLSRGRPHNGAALASPREGL